MARKKTNEEFVKEVHELVGDEYTFLEEYVNARTKIKCIHNTCGYEYYVTPDNFLSGKRCPSCYGTPKKTNKEFVKEVYKLVGDEYIFLEGYVDSRTKIKCMHNKCGHKYSIAPSSFLSGTRCPLCNGNKKKTSSQFNKEVYNLYGDEYTVLGQYKNNRTKIKVKHNKCNHVWYIKPYHFLKGHGCPQCNRPNYNRDTEYFKQEVFNLVQNEYSVVGKYKGALSYITLKHNICGHQYKVYPSAFLRGTRCPYCNNISKGEEKILSYLKQNNIIFKKEYCIEQCRGIKRPLPFDFAIFNSGILMLLIEYDGEHHYEPINFGGISNNEALINHRETLRNDNIKNQYCKDNNIPLLRIPYWKFDNTEQILKEWLSKYSLIHNEDIKEIV